MAYPLVLFLLTLLLLSHFSRVRLCVTPSLGFSRQEHWSGLPFPSPMHKSEKWKWSRSVMSDSSRPHVLQPTRLLCPWNFPGKSTGVRCHCLLRLLTLALTYFLNLDFYIVFFYFTILWLRFPWVVSNPLWNEVRQRIIHIHLEIYSVVFVSGIASIVQRKSQRCNF